MRGDGRAAGSQRRGERLQPLLVARQESKIILENVLANSLSPGIAASLDWSRGIAARGLR
jgi:hypothetical protein